MADKEEAAVSRLIVGGVPVMVRDRTGQGPGQVRECNLPRLHMVHARNVQDRELGDQGRGHCIQLCGIAEDQTQGLFGDRAKKNC